MLGGVTMPDEVAALIPDILAMPVSPATYAAILDRAVIVAQVHHALCRDGLETREAERLAGEAADWALARRQARRFGITEPPTPSLRIVTILDESEAEREAMAENEERVLRVALVPVGPDAAP